MRFKKIIIIGSGKIAISCLKKIINLHMNELVEVLETDCTSISMLGRICKKNSISYKKENDKRNIINYFFGDFSNLPTLIISANNRFIFPQEIVSNIYYEIINFHYSLLPNYRGSNIPSWVIWNNEQQTGVTWHYVDERIDHGAIIAQKTILISEMTTAYDIVKEGMILGAELFDDFIEMLLNKKIVGYNANFDGLKMYYSKEKPNNGYLLVDMKMEDMLRLLRAYDYGPILGLGCLVFNYKEKEYLIKGYHLKSEETGGNHDKLEGDMFIIQRDKKTLMLKIEGVAKE